MSIKRTYWAKYLLFVYYNFWLKSTNEHWFPETPVDNPDEAISEAEENKKKKAMEEQQEANKKVVSCNWPDLNITFEPVYIS